MEVSPAKKEEELSFFVVVVLSKTLIDQKRHDFFAHTWSPMKFHL